MRAIIMETKVGNLQIPFHNLTTWDVEPIGGALLLDRGSKEQRVGVKIFSWKTYLALN